MEGAMVRLQVPLLGFADIPRILQRSQPLQSPLRLIEEKAPTPMVGSTLVVSQMIQDAWGNLSVDMMTCQLSVIGMGPTPTVTVSEMPPSKMSLDLTRWSSASKILSGLYTHITLS